MKKHIVLLLLLGGLCTSAFGQGFYDPDTVHTIQLTFVQSNWDRILDSLYAVGLDERLVGTAIIDGVQYDSVGVRYKGNSTYSANRVKNPFNIKLDHIIEDQEIEGYGTLKLANCWSDPSFVREVLGYEIARKYMPAALANYVNVYVNGSLIGLYASVQDVDKLFLRTHFVNDENACFKGEFDGPPATYVIWGYQGADSASYSNLYELESDSGWADLIDFLDTLNNYTTAVESVLNVDRHLWMLAYDWLLVNLDAPVNLAHNYYLYRDDAQRFNPIIWDLNMDFGGFTQMIGGGGNLSITQMQQLDPYTYVSNSNYPLINKILSNTMYKKMYIAHMKTMIEENFSNNWYYTRGQELQTIINAHVQADPYKFYSYANFLSNLTTAVSGGMQSVVGITQLMNARVTYLTNRSDFQAVAPTIAVLTHTAGPVVANSQVQFAATVSNATGVYLAVKDELTEPFIKTAMYDDGSHNDGAAGDGVYGLSVQAGTTEMHYYVYAENANAASFLPPRAEFEDSVLAVQAGGLVINEFLTQNGVTQADQDGEYDDWIEFYNGSDVAVSLGGYYLTDNPSELTKWTFPDTTIPVGGYLVVWADEDDDQEGLHAAFKLSASGESIVLSDASLAVVDQVTFGAQTVDISTGRLPNGTGVFVTMTPTFGRRNGAIPVVINEFMAQNGVTQADQDGEYDDWIEFYNNADTAISLNGYYLTDNATNPTKWAFPDTSIAAGGYVVVWADEDIEQVGLHADFKLSASGEVIVLSDPSQEIIDQVTYGAQTTDISTGRLPNGTGDFVTMTPTFGRMNGTGGLVINEFLADNGTIQADQDDEYDDWVELYNGSGSAIELSGYYLTDDPANLIQWAFPDTSIEAGGYLIVWADDDEGQVGLHATFKLSASGEVIVLSDPSQEIIDQVTFGAQTEDVSTGRLPNGTGEFVVMTPTFGAFNTAGGGCCVRMGNVDGSTDLQVTMGDLTVLIDHLFISYSPLVCSEEGNLDSSADAQVTMGDLTVLIDHLFISYDPLPACP